MKPFTLILFLAATFTGYAQTAKLLKDHRYLQVIVNATARLNTNPNDKKAQQTLQQAYSGALVYFQAELARIQVGNDSFKWLKTLEILQETNDLADEIRYNSAAARIVCEPKIYTSEIQEAKKKAVAELYAAGQACMKQNTKEKAKEAYFLFKKISDLMPGYEGINDKISDARKMATCQVVIAPVQLDFNTLEVSTQKIDKEFFYWTQREVSSRPFIRFYTAGDADKQNIDPDFFIRIDVQDYRVERLASAQAGNGGTSNLVAIGNLNLKIYSSGNQEVVFKKKILCRYDSQTKSTIRVNTIDLQRVLDPDVQTFFDYMLLSNFGRMTEEIDNYFSTLAKQ